MPNKKKSQVAVIPTRCSANGSCEVCLVTTRTTKRWVVPKGWSEKGVRPQKVAEIEAYEEAGLKGKVAKKSVGTFEYFKRLESTFELVSVEVFVMEVDEELAKWPEIDQRKRRWFSKKDAVKRVAEPALAALLQSLPHA